LAGSEEGEGVTEEEEEEEAEAEEGGGVERTNILHAVTFGFKNGRLGALFHPFLYKETSYGYRGLPLHSEASVSLVEFCCAALPAALAKTTIKINQKH